MYQPYDLRVSDRQYSDLLHRIKHEGAPVMPQQEEAARMVFGHQMRFPLANGFPVITERDMVSPGDGMPSMFETAIGELCAFLNGARTQAELEAFGCGYWRRWVTEKKCRKRGLEPGDLGPGSYGAAWRTFPTSEGTPFDQVQHLMEQMAELPHLRTHVITPWIPQYIGRGEGKVQKVVVAPCHGWVHVLIDPVENTLSLHHFQRSADAPVGLAFNLIQYAALTLMLAHLTGRVPKDLVYTLSDAHLYEKQLPAVDRLLNAAPQRLPTVTLHCPPDSIFDFRPHHFMVSDYYPQNGRMTIWTPV